MMLANLVLLFDSGAQAEAVGYAVGFAVGVLIMMALGVVVIRKIIKKKQ